MKIQFAFVVVVCLLAASLSAQSISGTLYLSQQFNDDASHFSDDPAQTAEFDTGSGYGLAVSAMFGTRLSGELAVFRLSSSGEVRENGAHLADLGDLDLTPITAMLRVHFRPQQRVDFYAGAGLAHITADDLDSADLRSGNLAPIQIDDETTGVVGAGMIVNLSPRWGVVVDARYLPLDLTARVGDQKATADLNPLILSAGVRISLGR